MALSQAAQDAIAIRRYEIDDPVRQAKLDELLTEQAALDDKMVALQKERNAANDAFEQAKALVASVAGRKEELDALEAEIGKVSDAMTAEKIAWSAVRQRVDGEQKDLAESLQQHEGTVSAREAAVQKREADVADRESVVAEDERILAVKHDNLTAAIHANEQVDPTQLFVATGEFIPPPPPAMSIQVITAGGDSGKTETHEEA